MPATTSQSKIIMQRILDGGSIEKTLEALTPVSPAVKPLPPEIPRDPDYSEETVQLRRNLLTAQNIRLEQLVGKGRELSHAELRGNIENFIGFSRRPVGIIGPLRINGLYARGDFYIPLATTEGALVASYNRGARVISEAGGVSAACLTESVSRAPCFVFNNMRESGQFLSWLIPRADTISEMIKASSRHATLLDMKVCLNGKDVYLCFEFSTGDAAGQNMVTIVTDMICHKILQESPVAPQRWYIEGNMSGDKKATMQSFLSTRGRQVVAEVVIPEALVEQLLHTSPQEMVRYGTVSTYGGIQTGSIGIQGHYANALAALFIACGQDAACVSEAAIGISRMEVTREGALYVSVKMPNLIVGTVGGGTYLPTARECLDMIGCYGTGGARKFAEICAATVLAGEISISAAMTAGQFVEAHEKLGRKAKEKSS